MILIYVNSPSQFYNNVCVIVLGFDILHVQFYRIWVNYTYANQQTIATEKFGLANSRTLCSLIHKSLYKLR